MAIYSSVEISPIWLVGDADYARKYNSANYTRNNGRADIIPAK
jgi:hypothetical protein